MLQKIKREICIIKYRCLPLSEYDKKTNSDIYYYPKYNSSYWMKFEKKNNKLISELIELIKDLKIENLVFLGEINKPWISKFSRKNNKPLHDSLKYFKFYKIGKKFNGGIKLDLKNLEEFLFHFYIITQFDGSFFDYNFIDDKEKIIFHLHYSGDIKVLTLNENIDKKFLKKINESKFTIL